MARREVIVEVLDTDERCLELYGVAKAALVREVVHEGYVVRSRGAYARRASRGRRSQAVPGPTLEALMVPKFRKYVEGGNHADSSRPER